MSRRNFWPTIMFIGAALIMAWLCWILASSMSFGTCVDQHENSQAYQELGKEQFSIIRFFLRFRLYSDCAVHMANLYQGVITAAAAVVVAIFTMTLWISTHRLWESAEAQRAANGRAMQASSAQTLQSLAIAKAAADAAFQNATAAVVQAGQMERSAEQATRAADAMNEQRELMRAQREIMASQRDISSLMQRAWVGVVVKATGPIQFAGGQAFASITLELLNSGALPAHVDHPNVTAYPWGSTEPTSAEALITERINRHRTERVVRGSVILPQQTITNRTDIVLRKSEIEGAVNPLGGFVIAVRGAIRYDYPGDSETHSTTFHVLILRNPDPTMPFGVRTIPTDESTIPAGDLFVSYLMGETEAT